MPLEETSPLPLRGVVVTESFEKELLTFNPAFLSKIDKGLFRASPPLFFWRRKEYERQKLIFLKSLLANSTKVHFIPASNSDVQIEGVKFEKVGEHIVFQLTGASKSKVLDMGELHIGNWIMIFDGKKIGWEDKKTSYRTSEEDLKYLFKKTQARYVISSLEDDIQWYILLRVAKENLRVSG